MALNCRCSSWCSHTHTHRSGHIVHMVTVRVMNQPHCTYNHKWPLMHMVNLFHCLTQWNIVYDLMCQHWMSRLKLICSRCTFLAELKVAEQWNCYIIFASFFFPSSRSFLFVLHCCVEYKKAPTDGDRAQQRSADIQPPCRTFRLCFFPSVLDRLWWVLHHSHRLSDMAVSAGGDTTQPYTPMNRVIVCNGRFGLKSLPLSLF